MGSCLSVPKNLQVEGPKFIRETSKLTEWDLRLREASEENVQNFSEVYDYYTNRTKELNERLNKLNDTSSDKVTDAIVSEMLTYIGDTPDEKVPKRFTEWVENQCLALKNLIADVSVFTDEMERKVHCLPFSVWTREIGFTEEFVQWYRTTGLLTEGSDNYVQSCEMLDAPNYLRKSGDQLREAFDYSCKGLPKRIAIHLVSTGQEDLLK